MSGRYCVTDHYATGYTHFFEWERDATEDAEKHAVSLRRNVYVYRLVEYKHPTPKGGYRTVKPPAQNPLYK